MKLITLPDFDEKSDLFDWLIENKTALVAQKKSMVKEADAVAAVFLVNDRGDATIKAESIPADATKIKVQAVINTTKLFDSHDDVHIDGLWKKSIDETKDNFLVKQHQFNWEGIISDDVKVFTKTMKWSELGFDYKGTTQALIYEATITKSENPLMFEKYRTGKVKQHSVGMRYIKAEMAINDDRYEKEYGVWKKYYDLIANKADVDARGYFWAVIEAKNIEGSAVVKGANWATPTIAVSQQKSEPPISTRKEPVLPLKQLTEELKTKNIFTE
jgi:hypothetical protein